MTFLTPDQINRRTFLTRSAYGLGGLSFALLADRLLGSETVQPAEPGWRGALRHPHFPVKARRIIYLCMAGGPSHL